MKKELAPEDQRGINAELRFFEIVKVGGIAPWLCSIEPASALSDACGVDAIATIRRRADGKIVHVPIQIKSSALGGEQHFRKYPNHWFARVVVVVVNDDVRDAGVVDQLRRQLGHVHEHQYDFEDVFREIASSLVPLYVADFIAERSERMRKDAPNNSDYLGSQHRQGE